MLKTTLTAAVAALALCAPFAAMAQNAAQPTPVAYPGNQPFPGPDYAPTQTYNFDQPMMMAPPGSVWIGAHYSWDPSRQTYAWIDGQYAQPPHPNEQWVEGHWVQTPTSWVWMEGRWN